MRLDIILPDDSFEAVRLSAYADPVARVLKLIRDDADTEQLAPPPNYVDLMRLAAQSPNRFKSAEEVDAYIRELRDEWD